jgi:hypothetical protein
MVPERYGTALGHVPFVVETSALRVKDNFSTKAASNVNALVHFSNAETLSFTENFVYTSIARLAVTSASRTFLQT